MAGYIYFIKASDKLSMLYITHNNIDYLIVNKVFTEDVTLSSSGIQYQSKAILCIFSITLKKYFKKAIHN